MPPASLIDITMTCPYADAKDRSFLRLKRNLQEQYLLDTFLFMEGCNMKLTKEITMDLMLRTLPEPMDVARDDRFSRAVSVTLNAEGNPWEIPGDVSVLIRYRKPDGTGGVYDTMPDGSSAWSAEGNRLTFLLAPQVMTVPGAVGLTVTMLRQEVQLSTFLMVLNVHGGADGWQEESRDYHYVSAFLPMPETAAAGQYLRVGSVDDKGTVTALEAVELKQDAVSYNPQELSAEQKARARQNIGALAETALPNVTEEQEGCFLRVRNGLWAAVSVDYAEEEMF